MVSRMTAPRDELLIAMAEGLNALLYREGMVSEDISRCAQALRREEAAREHMDVTLRVLGAEDEYGTSEKHSRHVLLRFGGQSIHLKYEHTAAEKKFWFSKDGGTWFRAA